MKPFEIVLVSPESDDVTAQEVRDNVEMWLQSMDSKMVVHSVKQLPYSYKQRFKAVVEFDIELYDKTPPYEALNRLEELLKDHYVHSEVLSCVEIRSSE